MKVYQKSSNCCCQAPKNFIVITILLLKINITDLGAMAKNFQKSVAITISLLIITIKGLDMRKCGGSYNYWWTCKKQESADSFTLKDLSIRISNQLSRYPESFQQTGKLQEFTSSVETITCIVLLVAPKLPRFLFIVIFFLSS